MAETQPRVATELFSGSNHQSIQNPVFRSAGNDMNTYNFNFGPTGEPPASFWRHWARIMRQVSGYFQSPEHRDALRLRPQDPQSAGTNIIGAQYSIADTTSQEGQQENEDVAEDRSEDDHDVSEMLASLNMREMKSQSIVTNAEIYTRSMLRADAGLPCWHPEPRSPAGDRGVVPGDVGTFDLMDGFIKIFNIWEDESFAYPLPPNGTVGRQRYFREGRTIVSGTSAQICRSEDGRHIKSYQFRCKAPQGAVLVCTTSADLEELMHVAALREYLIQHAGNVYQHANAIRRVADDQPLYVVSGCIKSDSWAVAAYQEPTEPSDETLELTRRNASGRQPTRAPTYDWLSWMGEAKFGSNSEKVGASYQGKDQSLFLRGFKLAFSRECRARLNGTLRARCNDGGLDSKCTASGAGFTAANQGGGKVNDPPAANEKSGVGSSNSCMSTSQASDRVGSLCDGMQVDSFPENSRPDFHPSDCINKILMELTGSDCALCHDDDWRSHPRFSAAWKDISCFDVVASQKILVLNGVAQLFSRGEAPTPAQSAASDKQPSSTWQSALGLGSFINPRDVLPVKSSGFESDRGLTKMDAALVPLRKIKYSDDAKSAPLFDADDHVPVSAGGIQKAHFALRPPVTLQKLHRPFQKPKAILSIPSSSLPAFSSPLPDPSASYVPSPVSTEPIFPVDGFDTLPYKLPPGPYSHAKPDFSYGALAGQAILSSAAHMLSLQEIYQWIMTVYPYYKREETTWMNSVRHVLSTTVCFRKVPRDPDNGRTLWGILDEHLDCFKDGGLRKHHNTDIALRKSTNPGQHPDWARPIFPLLKSEESGQERQKSKEAGEDSLYATSFMHPISPEPSLAGPAPRSKLFEPLQDTVRPEPMEPSASSSSLKPVSSPRQLNDLTRLSSYSKPPLNDYGIPI